MKKIIYGLICILSIFLIDIVKVEGATTGKLSAGDIEMECVYDNGVVLSVYYSNGTYAMDASDFKLKNAIAPPYDTSLTIVYNEAEFAKQVLQSVSCPSTVKYGVVQQKDADGNYSTFEFYYRKEDSNYVTGGNSLYDYDFFKRKIVAGFEPVSGHKIYFMDISDGSILASRCALSSEETKECATFNFNLVNERVFLQNSIEPKERWAFKSEGIQASSQPMYFKVSEYVNEKGSTVQLAEKDGYMTVLSGVTMKTTKSGHRKVICVKPTSKDIDVESSDVAYNFPTLKHNATWYGDVKLEDFGDEYLSKNSCSNEGYSLYVEVDWYEATAEDSNGTSICDIIPETALILAEVVNYARIIVPVFLIILTGIDISRIVIAGNIEEELPKRKKTIFIRLIVSIIFFFLPLFVGIITAASYGVDFGDVDCIWK